MNPCKEFELSLNYKSNVKKQEKLEDQKSQKLEDQKPQKLEDQKPQKLEDQKLEDNTLESYLNKSIDKMVIQLNRY